MSRDSLPTIVDSGKVPALASLGLTAEDLASLATQGFVSVESRGPQSIYKLRYRRAGRQRVRYIAGADQATRVRGELDVLQQEVRLRRRATAVRRAAYAVLQRTKRELAPQLDQLGCTLHGIAVRRRRLH
jgi:hypothetical protein